jgi:predicted alpha/beta superfamily hydrolase
LIFFASTLLSQNTKSSQVSHLLIESPQLKTTKKIWLYLPLDYENSNQNYPVIYMFDGQNLFDEKTSFVGEWNIDEKMDSLKAKVIIVGIEHGNEKRIDELTPYKNEKYGGGKADEMLDFIINTLKPEIDKKYRTKSNAKNTVIMGSSLGGLTAYYATLKYPKVFGKAGVFSPAIWVNRKEIFAFTKEHSKIKSKIYFVYGDKEDDGDMIKDMNTINSILSLKRCDCLYLTKNQIIKGGQHNEKLWRDNFVKAYLWLL